MPPAVLALAGVFLVGFILPVVPLFPIRLAALIPLAATVAHPAAVVLVASLGAALGTAPLYLVARQARESAAVQHWLERRWVRRFLGWLEGRMFLAAFLFALLPLPDQLISLAGGFKTYPLGRLCVAFFLGRLPYFTLLATLGAANRGLILDILHRLATTLGF